MTDVKKTPEIKRINVADVLVKLASGYARYIKDDKGYGSIQGEFDLSLAECRELFNRPSLKGVKTRIPTLLVIEDDTVDTTEPYSPKPTSSEVRIPAPFQETPVSPTSIPEPSPSLEEHSLSAAPNTNSGLFS